MSLAAPAVVCVRALSHPRKGWHVVRVALGLLLLGAVVLKAHGLAIDPWSEDSFLWSPRLQFAALEVESLLALCLLSAWRPGLAWAGSLAFFTVVGGISLYQALAGQRSCGCFGQVEVHPWFTLMIDISAVGALCIWRPSGNGRLRPGAWVGSAVHRGIGALACLALLGVGIFVAWDHPPEAWARLRGNWITVRPGLVQVGDGLAGQQKSFSIQLTNHAERTVRVVGGTTNCACISTNDLPISLGPGESGSINVWMKFTGTAGRFQRRFTLYTDDEWARVIVARFAGRTLEPSP